MLRSIFSEILRALPSPKFGKPTKPVKNSQKGDLGSAPAMAEAVALYNAGELKGAENSFRYLVNKHPGWSDAWQMLGITLSDQKQYEEAIYCYETALGMDQNSIACLYHLGFIHREIGQNEKAKYYYRRALDLDGNHPEILSNLAFILSGEKNFSEAEKLYKQAISLQPDKAELYHNLAITLQYQGKLPESRQALSEGIELDPSFASLNRTLLSNILYQVNTDPQEIFQIHQEFEDRHAKPLYGYIKPHGNQADPNRRIKIGYVSSDFRSHPIAHNMEPIFRNHDRTKFETFVYSNVSVPDETTERLKSTVDHWCEIKDKDDLQVAEQTRSDGIDILIMLGARFDNNRPLICAYKPAPIQVSYHDPATTGLKVVDYLFSDITLNPRHTEEQFTEQLIRLPTYYLHDPIDAPEPNLLPAKLKGYITFGSFNNPAKQNEEVLILWARILEAIPESVLLLGFNNLYSIESIRNHCLNTFRKYGIDTSRIQFQTTQKDRIGHLENYHEIDIALDPFPFTGATTTFEALWMGVPVVTLAGKTMVSRWSASMLRRVGLSKLVSSTTDEYIGTAKSLAEDLDTLEDLRQSLREKVRNSPLCRAEQRTRHIERAFRYMWQKWCASHYSTH